MAEFNHENPQPSKLPGIKAFKTIQKNFAMIGIGPKLVKTQSYPLKAKIAIGSLISGCILESVYIFNDAETFSEYTQTIYGASAAIVLIFALVVLIAKVEKLFEFISQSNRLLNMSKWNFNL